MGDSDSLEYEVDLQSLSPTLSGRSKVVFDQGDGTCVVRLIPSLRSFTFNRDEMVEGTQVLRLDFYEQAAIRLSQAGVRTAFRRRLGRDTYLADFRHAPPFEVIVKNAAVGSTQRKYPGLFEDGVRFDPAVVKFDYRTDPEDEAIAEDYLTFLGHDVAELKRVALRTNEVLREWLSPNDLLDFCLVIARDPAGYTIISEISPDAMRLKSPSGASLDKDLFRQGRAHAEILGAWSSLVSGLGAEPEGLAAAE